MPTTIDLQHLRDWTGDVFWIALALAAVSYLITKGLDWLADRDARRIQAVVDEQAERRHLQAVMADRGTR